MRIGRVKLQFPSQGKYKREMKHYLSLLLLPLLLCIVLFLSVDRIITGQMRRHAELLSDHFYVQSNAMLREMQVVSSTLTRDSSFQRSISASSARDVDDMALCARLRECLQESAYVGHIYVISERLQHIYSDTGSFDYRSLPAILNKIGAETEDLLSVPAPEDEWNLFNRSNLLPYCVVPLTTSAGEPAGTLILTVKMTEFLRIFFSLDAEICCVFNDSFYVASFLHAIPEENFSWRDEQAVSNLVGTPVSCFYFDAGGYTYLVGLALSEYNKPLQSIILCFCLYAAAILVGGYLTLYRLSKKRYAQLDALIDALPTKHGGDSSLGDIYADIHKSLLEFRDQKESARQIAEDRLLHHLLYGYYHNISAEQLQAAGVPAPASMYYVAAFFIDDISNLSSDSKSADIYHVVRVIFRTTLTSLSEGKAGFASCTDPDRIVVVFSSNSGSGFREDVTSISGGAVKLISENYNVSLQAAISSPVTDPDRLPEAFQETQRLRSFARSINSDVPILSQEEMQSGGGGMLLNGDFIRKEQILMNTLLAGKYGVVPSMAAAILAEHVSALRQNYSLAQDRLTSIANVLAEGVLAANLPGLPAEAADRLRKADSVLKINEAAEQIYGQMSELMNSSVCGSDTVARACKYIQDHADDQNLNVSAICTALDISVQRLTRMFQASLDMTVAEYINAHRINLAKELLTDKHLTIVQIATKAGYSNTDTLTRNFRKLEGITPSEYRKLLT